MQNPRTAAHRTGIGRRLHFAATVFFAILDLPADTFVFDLVELRQKFQNLGKACFIDGVSHPQAVSPGMYETRFYQNLHMVAQGRLGERKALQQVTSGQLAAREHVNDAQSRFVTQCFE